MLPQLFCTEYNAQTAKERERERERERESQWVIIGMKLILS